MVGADVIADPLALGVVTPGSPTTAALGLSTTDAVASREVPASSIDTPTPTAEAAACSFGGCGVDRAVGFAVASTGSKPAITTAPITKFVRRAVTRDGASRVAACSHDAPRALPRAAEGGRAPIPPQARWHHFGAVARESAQCTRVIASHVASVRERRERARVAAVARKRLVVGRHVRVKRNGRLRGDLHWSRRGQAG